MGSFSDLRQRLGLSLEEVAADFGSTSETVASWDSGQAPPPVHVLRTLSFLRDFTGAEPLISLNPARSGCAVEEAVSEMALAGIEERGAVFTRQEVTGFILDLAGYEPGQPLHLRRLLEPSVGRGDFLFPAVERLLQAYRAAGGSNPGVELADAVRAVELHAATFDATGKALEGLLQTLGLEAGEARALRAAWLEQGDFLLKDFDPTFDYVVGNPPYVRQELVPDVLMAEYRRRYSTIFDRADIYIPFIERSLSLLRSGGVLGFICADRWMKNRYGRHLRQLIASNYHLRTFVDMVDTRAFTSDVIAYPGIFIVAREGSGDTKIARQPAIAVEALRSLSAALASNEPHASVKRAVVVQPRGEPWIVETSAGIDLVRRLEAELPKLEEAGCKVGIGVATGADNAYIGPLSDLDVEDDRKLPLIMTRDIASGEIAWRGQGVINPFANGTGLVDLEAYPRLRRYLEERKTEIAGRHVAQKSAKNWYRTIDRIYPELVRTPKLLIPDIKGEAHIVYDEGAYYPHHNLYFITSDWWDLRALQAVLLSGVTRLFISTYSTKMRGGYLRYQAQYLRRIRIPQWRDVPAQLRALLVSAGERRDRNICDAAMIDLYGLSGSEQDALAEGKSDAA